uniref:Rieske domain-containing protein n=1 Tax=Ciona savignyi TaxID=51511 RepID=H2ZIW8_CIOSA
MSQDHDRRLLDAGKKNLNQTQMKPKVWQFIGFKSIIETAMCQRVYASTCKKEDVALFFVRNKFYAINATCPHVGGPLDTIVDMEDLLRREVPHVICPWHHYVYNLETGIAEEGLKAEIYNVKVEEEKVYILHHAKLSLKPFETEI